MTNVTKALNQIKWEIADFEVITMIKKVDKPLFYYLNCEYLKNTLFFG